MTTVPPRRRVNGVDVDALAELLREVATTPAGGRAEFRVRSEWRGQTRSRAAVESYTIGSRVVHRHFTIDADEPFELLGRNTAPTPEELLLAALTASLTVGYVTVAALRGIALERVEVQTSGATDLHGLLGLEDAPTAPLAPLGCRVLVTGAAPAEQLRALHETVIRTSPGALGLARSIVADARVVEV
jgi:hypothetical protein